MAGLHGAGGSGRPSQGRSSWGHRRRQERNGNPTWANTPATGVMEPNQPDRSTLTHPGRREIDVRAQRLRRFGPRVAAIVARRAAHRPSRCRVGARLRAGISLGSSRSAIVRSRSSRYLAFPFPRFQIRGFGAFRIMLLPCPIAEAMAIERRSVPGESRPDR
jgi:hypothetical protein